MSYNRSIVAEKSYRFSLQIIELYKALTINNKEYVLSRQILRCGTSIGANVEEGRAAISRKDFISKNSIALKEARETHYWLRLLRDTNFLPIDFIKLIDDCYELIKILTSIVKTTQSRL